MQFCGREDSIDKMQAVFEQGALPRAGGTETIPRRVVILHGLGGVGKSTIALEYWFRWSKSYTSVFWADASSEASLFQSARGIAEHLISHYASQGVPYGEIDNFLRLGGLLGHDRQIMPVEGGEQRVAGAIKQWLAVEGNGRWLLILDNYDDIGSVNIHELLPTCDAGHVIVTSRRSDLQGLGRRLLIDEIDERSGILLLLKSADKEGVDTRGKHPYQGVLERKLILGL
jgi:hypothetical protein